jgi:hypothetical protein
VKDVSAGFFHPPTARTERIMLWLILFLVEVCWGNVHDLFAGPNRKHSWHVEQSLVDGWPIHFVELMGKEDTELVICLTSRNPVGPKA